MDGKKKYWINCRLTLVILLCTFASCDNKHNLSTPNVLLIMVDDLRDWTGYSNQFSNVRTPNLNMLAGQGQVFTNAYCSAPVCAPSRTSMLSGLNPGTTGIYENGQIWEDDLRQHETLTKKFMNEGYYVAGFGKIYHGAGDGPYWDEYIYGEYSPLPEVFDNYNALGNPLDVDDSVTGDWKRVENAIKLLQRDIEKPLFLACGLIRPHTPWNVPRKYFEMYDTADLEIPEIITNDLEDIPAIGKKIAHRVHHDHYGKSLSWTHQSIVDSGLWKINIQAYLASVTYADAQIGRLLDAWNQSKYAKNGIIILTGDHGWHHGEKEHWSKRTLWEEGTRTPLIFVVPGVTQAGAECNKPVSLLDIYPTLIDLCQLPPKLGIEGISIKPLLYQPNLDWNIPATTTWGKDNVAIRLGDWRYIQYCDGSQELYNRSNDPNEWYNLLNEGDTNYTDVINQLKQWIPVCKEPNSFAKNRISWFVSEGITN